MPMTMLPYSSSPLLAEIAFRGSFSLWYAIPLIVLSFIAVFGVYFRESMKMHPARRMAMATLRGLAIAAILLLLCKPVIVTELDAEKPKQIVLLVDNTQSMTQHDPRLTTEDRIRVAIAYNTFPPDYGLSLRQDDSYTRLSGSEPTRAEMVMAAFQNPALNLRERLREKGPLREALFGAQVHGAARDWEKNLSAGEAKTAVIGSINELLQVDDNDLPAAIVLVTDGRDNASTLPWDEVGRECARQQIPIHVYGVGGGTTGVLQLKEVPMNDTLFVEDTVRVPFRWRCQGIKEAELELNVTLGGRIVATKRRPVSEGEEITDVLSFNPEKRDVTAGKQELVASIKVVGGRDEDKISKPVRIVESKVKVLCVENAPRWEFKFLMRAFQRDRRIDSAFIIVNADKKTLESGVPFLPVFPETRKELFAYDLLIIGDVDANYFSAEQRSWIKDFVADGGGLIMIAGRLHAPASYAGKTVGDILPVEFEAKQFPIDDRDRPEEYRPKLSDVGLHEAVMSLADTAEDNQRIWGELPGWYWSYPVTKLKPAAISLLDHPKLQIEDKSPLAKNGKRPMPLIARHYYGRGLVTFVGDDETWRWRFNEGDKYFARFWGQMVYQVGLPHLLGNKSQIILGGDAVQGKETKVYARLFTPDFKPLERERVAAVLERQDNAPGEDRRETIYFEPDPDLPEKGMYVATIPQKRQGSYNLKLSDNIGDGTSLDFRVMLPPEHEMAPGNMNEDALRKLAAQTGGKFYREETLKDLPNDVVGKTVKLEPPPRIEILVWTRWWALMLVISLLTAEWLVRKFSNLS